MLQMLRISSFALGTDLLLYPNGKGQLFGFITRAGMIEEQATAEYNYYIQRKQLVRAAQSKQILF